MTSFIPAFLIAVAFWAVLSLVVGMTVGRMFRLGGWGDDD